MCLFFGQNVDEFVKICNTSAGEEFKKFVIALTSVHDVDNMFSLWPRDASDISKLSDKLTVRLDEIQQLNTIDSQCPHPIVI